jgi:hypothetical protein
MCQVVSLQSTLPGLGVTPREIVRAYIEICPSMASILQRSRVPLSLSSMQVIALCSVSLRSMEHFTCESSAMGSYINGILTTLQSCRTSSRASATT